MRTTVTFDNSAGREAAQDGLPTPRRYWSAVAIWIAISMSVLDSAIANVALPTIAHELHASPASSIWIVNAYQLAITVALLPLAALGDRIGYRRVYLGGLAIFTLGSLSCALSHSLVSLTAARVLQGFGAAGIMSINAALVRFTYPRRLLGRGIGLNAVVVSLAAALGPTVASAILSVASWEWLFAVNVPIGLLAIAIASRALPTAGGGASARLDKIAAVLNVLTFGLLITGLEALSRGDLMSGLGELGLGAVAGVFLVRRELHEPAPLTPIDLMRIPIFGLSVGASIVSFSAQMLAYVVLPFYFQGALDRSAVQTGLLMTPWPLAVGVTAPLAGRLADRYPAGLLGGIGLAIFAAGLLALSRLHPGASDADIIWRMVLCGAGFGFFQSPNNRAMVSSAPMNRSGAAGGMLATARLLGQTTGAVVAAMYFRLAGGHAMVASLTTASVMAGAAAVISLTRLRIPANRPAVVTESPMISP
jgi:DHA2 family multidrug resistance protein-like MFS transporter